MQVDISDKARETIEAYVRDGEFETTSEALDAAVALLEADRAEHAKLEALIEEGRRDIREGRYLVLTRESAEALKRRITEEGHARLTAKQRA